MNLGLCYDFGFKFVFLIPKIDLVLCKNRLASDLLFVNNIFLPN